MKNSWPAICILILSACFTGCSGKPHKGTPQDTDSCTFLLSAFNDTIYKDPAAAARLAEQALQQAPDSSAYYFALAHKALAQLMLNRPDSMLQTCRRILDCAGTDDSTGRKTRCLVHNTKGIFFSINKQSDSAIASFRNAISLAPPSQLPQVYMNLAENHVQNGDYIAAAENYRLALHLNDSLGHVLREDLICNGLATTYMQISDYEEAEKLLRRSMRLFSEMEDLDRYVLLNHFGNLYYYKGEYAKALPYFRQAEDCARNLPNRNINSYVPVFNQAEIHILLHRLDSARICLDTLTAVLSKEKAPVFESHLRTLLLALAVESGDMPAAGRLAAGMKGEQLPPPLARIRNRYLQSYYEKSGNFAKAYAVQTENYRTDDSLRNTQVKTRVADIYLRYRQDTTLLAKQAHIRQQADEIRRSRTQTAFWSAIAVMLAGLAATVYLLMRRRQERITEQHMRKIGEMRMENIRNCLSPHFTFNVLNHEIARFADNDPRRTQMMNLVKILRKCMEVSSQMTVTLQEELDFVSTYIALECGEWGKEFTFSLHVDEAVDTLRTIIPTMFIQIPTENAIKHGLRAADGHKQLEITVAAKQGGTLISIRNNGTGYRPKLLTSGTGKGMQVIYQTIMLLNARNSEKITFSITQDNPSQTGSEGTRVEIYLPRKFDYSKC